MGIDRSLAGGGGSGEEFLLGLKSALGYGGGGRYFPEYGAHAEEDGSLFSGTDPLSRIGGFVDFVFKPAKIVGGAVVVNDCFGFPSMLIVVIVVGRSDVLLV